MTKIINSEKITAVEMSIAILMYELQEEAAIELLEEVEEVIVSSDGEEFCLTEALWLLDEAETRTLCHPTGGSWAVDDLESPYGTKFDLIRQELREACGLKQPAWSSSLFDCGGSFGDCTEELPW